MELNGKAVLWPITVCRGQGWTETTATVLHECLAFRLFVPSSTPLTSLLQLGNGVQMAFTDSRRFARIRLLQDVSRVSDYFVQNLLRWDYNLWKRH